MNCQGTRNPHWKSVNIVDGSSRKRNPLLEKEGWPRHQETFRRHLVGADGVVIQTTRRTHHPVCAYLRWLRSICLTRSHPSCSRRGFRPHDNTFTPSWTAPTVRM